MLSAAPSQPSALATAFQARRLVRWGCWPPLGRPTDGSCRQGCPCPPGPCSTRPGRPGWLKNARGSGAACPQPASRLRLPSCAEGPGGGGPRARPTPLVLATCRETRRREGPLRTERGTPSPFPGERSPENNGEPVGVGSKGVKGVPPAVPRGRPEAGRGPGEGFRRLSPAKPPPQLPGRAPPPARDAGCAGMRGDARRCRRGPGPSGVASWERRSRSWVVLAPALGVRAPSPSPALPKRAWARRSQGWGPAAPRSHRLASASPLPSRSRFSAAASRSGREPRSRLRALSSRGRPRRAAGLSTRGQTTPPTDGRVSRLPAAGIPRVGGGRGRAQGRRGGEGGGGRGGDRSQPWALTHQSLGRPKSSPGPRGTQEVSLPQAGARHGVRCRWVACLKLGHLYIPVAQSRAWHILGAQ